MRPRSPKAPDHLEQPTKAWWSSVTRDYVLEPHHVRLLQLACEAWDQAQTARAMLARDGLVIGGREGGMRPHPAVAIERDARLAFCRTLREMDLDFDPPAQGVRPPALHSNRRGG